jgi:hypothetical protein
MTLMYSLRANPESRCDLRPRPTRRSGLAHLVLLAHLRNVPKRYHTEEPKLWVLVDGEPDQPKASLGGHCHSRRDRNSPGEFPPCGRPDRIFCTTHQPALITR